MKRCAEIGHQGRVDTRAFAPAASLGHSVPIMHYAVTSDGKRFLVARPLGTGENDAAATPLTVILNWPAALNAR